MVVQSTVVVQTFVLVNLSGPGYIGRPAGSTGGDDTTVTRPDGGTTTTTAPSSSTTASTTTTPATSTTAPAGDFCTEAATWVPLLKNFVLAGFGTSTYPDGTALLASTDRLIPLSPSDGVRTDLEAIRAFVASPTEAGAQYEPDALEAYLKGTCGIDPSA